MPPVLRPASLFVCSVDEYPNANEAPPCHFMYRVDAETGQVCSGHGPLSKAETETFQAQVKMYQDFSGIRLLPSQKSFYVTSLYSLHHQT